MRTNEPSMKGLIPACDTGIDLTGSSMDSSRPAKDLATVCISFAEIVARDGGDSFGFVARTTDGFKRLVDTAVTQGVDRFDYVTAREAMGMKGRAVMGVFEDFEQSGLITREGKNRPISERMIVLTPEALRIRAALG
jgi:hypothetical protein